MTHADAHEIVITEPKPDAVALPPTPTMTHSAPIEPASLTGAIEAILLSADRMVPAPKLAAALGLIPDSLTEDGGSTHPASDTASPDTTALPPQHEPSGHDSSLPESPSAHQTEPAADAAGHNDARASKPRKSRRKPTDAALSLRARAIDAVRDAVAMLNHDYEQTKRSFRIELLAGGYRVMTLPAFAGAIAAYQGARAKTALSPAALEALAIIAYKQPMTRAKLEAIRGVACGEILRTLLDRKLITITGRAEELGRPLLYGTSKRFLELFGLSTLKDLPSVEELRTKA